MVKHKMMSKYFSIINYLLLKAIQKRLTSISNIDQFPMSSIDPHSQLVLGLKKLAGDITSASASGDGVDATTGLSNITVILEKFDEEKSVVDSNVSVDEQLAALLATVSGSDRVFGSSLPSSAVSGIPRAAVSIPGMDRSVVPATARQTISSCRNGGSPSTGSARRRD